MTRLMTLVLAALLINPSLVSAQDDTRPQRSERTQQRRDQSRQRSGQQLFAVNPESDPVLKVIRDAVEPTDEQLAVITAALIQLREDQQEAFQKFRSELRTQRGGDDARGQRGARPPRGDRAQRPRRGERTDGEQRPRRGERPDTEQREQMMEQLNAAFEPLNAAFLTDTRAVLNEPQLNSWDACATELELNPLNARRDRDAGGPNAGDSAPKFNIVTTEGKAVSLESLLDKPTVIEFASYTCPIYRGKIDKLKELRDEFEDTINYVVIYTREAHASDGRRPLDRNLQAGIDIKQHASFDERQQCAARMQEELELDGVTILVDSFDNVVTDAYRGHPNRGYVIDTNGVVRSRQAWIDANETRAVLSRLLKSESDI